MSALTLPPDGEGDLSRPQHELYVQLVEDYEAQQFGGSVILW